MARIEGRKAEIAASGDVDAWRRDAPRPSAADAEGEGAP
jgi:hypothetical protein